MEDQPYYIEEETTDESIEKAAEEAKRINSLIVGTFQTQIGQNCLNHLESTFIDRDIYVNGLTFEQTAFRQGQASLIRQIRQTLEGATNGR